MNGVLVEVKGPNGLDAGNGMPSTVISSPAKIPCTDESVLGRAPVQAFTWRDLETMVGGT